MPFAGYLSTAEVAELLGVSRPAVTHYYRQGRLRGESAGGRLWFRAADVRRFKRRPRGNPNFGGKSPGRPAA